MRRIRIRGVPQIPSKSSPGRNEPTPSAAAWRWGVAWRTLLAIVGGYAVCALLAAAMGRLLPRLGVARIEAAAGGDLTAIVLLPLAPVLVFAARSAWKPTLAIAGAIAVLGLAIWTAGPAT